MMRTKPYGDVHYSVYIGLEHNKSWLNSLQDRLFQYQLNSLW